MPQTFKAILETAANRQPRPWERRHADARQRCGTFDPRRVRSGAGRSDGRGRESRNQRPDRALRARRQRRARHPRGGRRAVERSGRAAVACRCRRQPARPDAGHSRRALEARQGANEETFPRTLDDEVNDSWTRSPFFFLLESGAERLRRRLDATLPSRRVSAARRVQEQGVTDYVAFVYRVGEGVRLGDIGGRDLVVDDRRAGRLHRRADRAAGRDHAAAGPRLHAADDAAQPRAR